MKQNQFMLIALVILVLGLVFQYYQNQQNLIELRREIARSVNRPASTKEGKASVDPYQAKQVKNTLTKHSKNLQTCYLTYLNSKPAATKGQIKMDWQITDEGKTIEAGIVYNSFQDQDLGDCLLLKLKAITFPPPPFGTHYIEHSLNFQTEEDLKKMLDERAKLQQLGK